MREVLLAVVVAGVIVGVGFALLYDANQKQMEVDRSYQQRRVPMSSQCPSQQLQVGKEPPVRVEIHSLNKLVQRAGALREAMENQLHSVLVPGNERPVGVTQSIDGPSSPLVDELRGINDELASHLAACEDILGRSQLLGDPPLPAQTAELKPGPY